MVAFVFDPLYLSLWVFLLAAIPGIALGWPLLKGSKFSLLEKFLISFFLGLVAVPSLLFLEALMGIKFSLFLVLADLFIVVAAGVFWGVKNNAFEFRLPGLAFSDAQEDWLGFSKKHIVTALLLLAVLLAFWIRIQTFSPIYSELDPYYYVYETGQIITDGIVPPTDDSAWWPVTPSLHRDVPVKAYIEAEWYAVYTGGAAYSNDILFTVACWLPPLSAALMAFGAYLLVSSVYGKRYGLLAAFLMAFSSVTIFKMSAGVNEAVPMGLMLLFISLGSFAYSLANRDRRMGVVSAVAFFATVTGSKFLSVLAMPFAAILVLQSLDYFIRGKKNEEFLVISGMAFSGLALGVLLNGIYTNSVVSSFVAGQMPMVIIAAAFAGVMYWLEGLHMPEKKRQGLVALGAVLALLALFFTPVGDIVQNKVNDYVGFVQYNVPLLRTIAEQNLAGTSFEGENGFIALVPENHIAAGEGANPLSNAMYGLLQAISVPFTFLGNLSLAAIDTSFNVLLGTHLSTGAKDVSLLFAFFVIATAGMIWRHFSRKGDERDAPSLTLLILFFTVPILYVGMNKVKFSIFAGVALVVIAAVAIAELEAFFLWFAGKIKSKGLARNVRAFFIVLIAAMVLAQATIPSNYPVLILSKSFEMRYQDNPAAMMPKMAAMCDEIRKKGYASTAICSSGSDPNYPDSINNQFNSEVCMVSQLTTDELFPASDAASQQRAAEARGGASFRCNRIADYWIDSMEWMNKNIGADARVTSWWDYGHWTNYLAERKTVLRNDHASRGMIGVIAHDYIIGSTADLAKSMNYFDSQYALFDVELIGGSSFGGKYGALNYLGCVHEGATTVANDPGSSDCEFDHSPERIVIPKLQDASTICTISESQQRTGVYAFTVGKTGVDQGKPAYCVGEVTLLTGDKISATYYLDRKDSNGDLMLSKGFIRTLDDQADSVYAEMVYNTQRVWPGENGTWVGGMEDAKTAFYTSNLYKGFYLEELPGFELVYKSANGEVKIYKLLNFTGNKAGIIDPSLMPNDW